MMNERRRTEYLEAMGIQTFVPRWILPAARPSQQAPLPEPEAVESPAKDERPAMAQTQALAASETRATSTQRVTGVVSGIIGELAGQEAMRAKPESAPSASIHTPAKRVLDVLEGSPTTEIVSFSLSLWRVSDGLMVIDSHQAKQALPTHTLLSNILLAKGMRTPLSRPEVLSWPMVGGAADEGGWQQACEMVQAFLNARFERQPVQSVWLMGEAAYRAVCAGEDHYRENMGKMRDLDTLNCLAVVLPSLTDMLKSPSLKAPAWQAIKVQTIA